MIDREVKQMKVLFLSILVLVSTPLQAADWADCKRVKKDTLRMQQALRKGHSLRGYSNRAALRAAYRDKNDWLWKHCRQFSGELRDFAARR